MWLILNCLIVKITSFFPEYSEHTAVIGSEISIPCNVTASLPDDQVTLILWYRGDSGNPIYSVDTRQVQGASPKIFAHKQLQGRDTFNISRIVATLNIKPVKENDGGEYRCRVDFRRSRTMNSVMKVIIIGEYIGRFRKGTVTFYCVFETYCIQKRMSSYH